MDRLLDVILSGTCIPLVRSVDQWLQTVGWMMDDEVPMTKHTRYTSRGYPSRFGFDQHRRYSDQAYESC